MPSDIPTCSLLAIDSVPAGKYDPWVQLPVIRGTIDRRILVNFRVDPQWVARLLPPPFRPQLVAGQAIAGICLIRMRGLRPRFLSDRTPDFVGLNSENAAHRIAVEWSESGVQRTGVFVPRRDTNSLLASFAGGRVFPGVHHRASFVIRESSEHFFVQMRSHDDAESVLVEARQAGAFPQESAFGSLEEASRFFEEGSLGYSCAPDSNRLEGLELRTHSWEVQPLEVLQVDSSFFAAQDRFPEGTVTLDNALLMRGIRHDWHKRPDMVLASGT